MYWGGIAGWTSRAVAVSVVVMTSAQQIQPVPGAQAGAEQVVTVFVTGCTLGQLRPCGCAGGQLGGLERLASILHQAPAQRRLVIDTGWWTKDQDLQSMLKALTLARGLQVLGYDILHLARQDLGMALASGTWSELSATMGLIASDPFEGLDLPRSITRTLDTPAGPLAIRAEAVRAEEVESRLRADLGPAAGALGWDLLVVQGHAGLEWQSLEGSAQRPVCVILPADSDQPHLISRPDANPLVFSVGRYGRYVVRLDMFLEQAGSAPRLAFAAVPVSEEHASHPELVDLYRQYQQLVAESGLLASYPRLPLPGRLRFVGSTACWRCHRYEYQAAIAQPHARAYATLEAVGSHMDPECVVCHVVGLGYEGGFASVDQTPDLKDVGCEVCHGPGSEHVRTGGRAKTTGPRLSCLDCHSPDHSPAYMDQADQYFQKILHWKEPTGSGVVKPQ